MIISLRTVASARSASIERVIEQRKITLRGRVERVGPCPRCGGHDRFAINIKKQCFNCRGCRVGGDVIKLVMFLDGCDFKAACGTLSGEVRAYPLASPQTISIKDDERRRIRQANEVWSEGLYPKGTIAEQYLAARKLDLALELCSSVLRYHPRCPWKDRDTEQVTFVPCLIAVFRNIIDDEISGVHRIRLDRPSLWPKTQRMMLGVVAGSAVKFDTAGPQLHIGEGVETCMAARQLGFRPTWAFGSTSAFAKFKPIPGTQQLFVLGERDEASRKAADACAQLWHGDDRRIFFAVPRGGVNDFNDYVMRAANGR